MLLQSYKCCYNFVLRNATKFTETFERHGSLETCLKWAFLLKHCASLTPSFKVRILIPLPQEQIRTDLLFFTVLNSRKNTKITINESLIFDFRFYILPTKRYTRDTQNYWILNAKLSFSRIFGNFVRDIWEILYVMLKGWNHNDFSLFLCFFIPLIFTFFVREGFIYC